MCDQPHDRVDEIIERHHAILMALQRASQPLWMELDLSAAQLKTLFALAHHGPATVGQVADALNIQPPTASHLVDRLVQSGFAERTEDPSDRRRAVVQLSERGAALARRLRQGSREQMRASLAQLPREDQEALLCGLRAWVRVVLPEGTEGCE